MLRIKSALILSCVVQFSMPWLHAESGPAFILMEPLPGRRSPVGIHSALLPGP